MSARIAWLRRKPSAEVRVEESAELSVRGLAPRTLQIYLPPGYSAKRAKAYPLLFALDGQMMPHWRLAETLNELVALNQIEPVVVAAVPASAERIDEYGTASGVDFAGRGKHARAFQELLAGVALPWLRENFNVSKEAARTGVFGALMGGLCAFDTVLRRPSIFGVAGIFSGSLWWRDDSASLIGQQVSRIAHRNVRELGAKPALRLWFEAGTRDETDDRDNNGVIDAIQDTTELMDELERKGFVPGKDMNYLQMEGGEHNEATWALALPEFLRWALPKK
ncbi:alpha/beta hydrolase [Oleiharenicola lentus]|uniref:alpha/beta hydrolase n=1 Tax=Oleiharenicola lentus TaxID=2508720 RepID=UPI003F6810B3